MGKPFVLGKRTGGGRNAARRLMAAHVASVPERVAIDGGPGRKRDGTQLEGRFEILFGNGTYQNLICSNFGPPLACHMVKARLPSIG